jgi:hypothetical protein
MAVMNAMQIHQYGAPDVFVYEEVQRPVPGAGEVLVRVRVLSELRTQSKKLTFSGERIHEKVQGVGRRNSKRGQFGAKVGEAFTSSLVVF